MSTRYDVKNCNAQCIKCNRFDEGNMLGYTKGLVRKYGSGILDELEIKKKSISKLSVFEYNTLINHYKSEIEKLKNDKILQTKN